MRKILLLLLAAALLTGCAGRQMEEETVVIALAVDRGADGVRLAVKAPAAAQQAAQDDQKGYWTLQAAGETFADAMTLLNASTPRKLNFAQVREVIISEEAAAGDGLPDLLRSIAALPRMRAAARVIVCRGSACRMAEQLKPYMGLRLSRYADDSLSDAAQKGFTPDTTLAQALRDLGSGLTDPLFILGAVNDFSSDAALAVSDARAGSLPRKSPDPIDLFGAAVTDGQRVTGTISGDEMALLHLLMGGGHTYADTLSGTPVTLYARGKAELSVDLAARPIRLRVRLLCGAQSPVGKPVDLSALQSQTETKLLSLFQTLQELHCDALGFGDRAVRGFLFTADWERLDFKRLYREAEWDVSVTLRRLSD